MYSVHTSGYCVLLGSIGKHASHFFPYYSPAQLSRELPAQPIYSRRPRPCNHVVGLTEHDIHNPDPRAETKTKTVLCSPVQCSDSGSGSGSSSVRSIRGSLLVGLAFVCHWLGCSGETPSSSLVLFFSFLLLHIPQRVSLVCSFFTAPRKPVHSPPLRQSTRSCLTVESIVP